MDPRSRPAELNLAVASTAVAAAVAVMVTSIGVVTVVSRPSTGLIIVGLCLPTFIGILLLWRASVYTWRRGASRPRAFAVDEGRAFLLLPDRPTMRAVAFVLMCTFPVGYPIVQAWDSALGVIDWATFGVAVFIVPTAALHAIFLCRGAPRPLVEVTSAGLTAWGFLGAVHVAWDMFAPSYGLWPDRQLRLSLPVYTRLAVQRRGLRPYGVRLPARHAPFYEPFDLSAAWATNPWWASQALAFYYQRPYRRSEIGTRAEHELLASQLRAYKREIDEQLGRFR